MAAMRWADLDPTRPADHELLSRSDEETLRSDTAALIRLAQGVFSYTNGLRELCGGCYWKPLRIAQMAMNHERVQADYIISATQRWEGEFGGWRGVNGMEAFARRYERRTCNECAEELP